VDQRLTLQTDVTHALAAVKSAREGLQYGETTAVVEWLELAEALLDNIQILLRAVTPAS
jgi:hypothetical protein